MVVVVALYSWIHQGFDPFILSFIATQTTRLSDVDAPVVAQIRLSLNAVSVSRENSFKVVSNWIIRDSRKPVQETFSLESQSRDDFIEEAEEKEDEGREMFWWCNKPIASMRTENMNHRIGMKMLDSQFGLHRSSIFDTKINLNFRRNLQFINLIVVLEGFASCKKLFSARNSSGSGSSHNLTDLLLTLWIDILVLMMSGRVFFWNASTQWLRKLLCRAIYVYRHSFEIINRLMRNLRKLPIQLKEISAARLENCEANWTQSLTHRKTSSTHGKLLVL